MKFEEREKNNKPEDGSKNLPVAVLFVLITVICLLLFIGWKYFSDTSSSSDEMLPVKPETVETQMSTTENSEVVTDESMKDPSVTEDEGLPEITIPSATTTTKVEDKKEATAAVEAPATQPTAALSEKPKPAVPTTYSGESYTHVVASGETFYSIARRYNVSTDKLKTLNPTVDASAIKVGVTKIKAPVQAIHTVGPGDILRVVANKYGITLEQLMKANGKTKNNAQRGEKLVIPVK